MDFWFLGGLDGKFDFRNFKIYLAIFINEMIPIFYFIFILQKPKELLRWFQNFPITFIDRNPCVFFIVGIHVILSMMKQIEIKF